MLSICLNFHQKVRLGMLINVMLINKKYVCGHQEVEIKLKSTLGLNSWDVFLKRGLSFSPPQTAIFEMFTELEAVHKRRPHKIDPLVHKISKNPKFLHPHLKNPPCPHWRNPLPLTTDVFYGQPLRRKL